MSFTDIFIRRRVLATVVSLLILLIGAYSGFRLQNPAISRAFIDDDLDHNSLSRSQRRSHQRLHHDSHCAGRRQHRGH